MLARPGNYPTVLRGPLEHVEDNRKYLVDYTYFPAEWSPDQVRAASDGAWASPEFLWDEETGVWSGVWKGMELAGYFDKATGQPLVHFPVISP